MQNWIPIGAALAVVVYIIAAFNRLVSLRYRVRDAWAQIDVQLKRRHDLIPNLVNAVKGYMDHEREVLEGVTRARQQAMAAGGDVNSVAAAEAALTLATRSNRVCPAVLQRFGDGVQHRAQHVSAEPGGGSLWIPSGGHVCAGRRRRTLHPAGKDLAEPPALEAPATLRFGTRAAPRLHSV